MFLLDSLLLAPGTAFLSMFEELAKKAQEEFLDDDSVKQELQDIYARLEAGQMSEQEFETRELSLMQRLEQIARAKFEGSWGTPAMGLQRAFLPGAAEDDPNLLPTAVTEAEILPAGAPVPVPVVDVPAIVQRIIAGANVDPRPEAPALRTVVPDPPPPPAVPAAPVAPAPPAGPAALTMTQVVESTLRHMSMLKMKVSAVTAVSRLDDGWRVTAEMLERKAVPDTSDLLGVYDLQLDAAGNVLRYERTHIRRRSDLGR